MKGILKKTIAFLLILSLFLGILPTEAIGRRLEIFRTMAAAEEERAAIAADASENLENRFSAAAGEAEARAAAGEISDNGEWRYVVLPEQHYAVIIGHRNQGNSRVDLPVVLGDADVVAILSGSFDDHPELREVTFSANIYYAGESALPRGVSVRGYHGSYAQHWAAENSHSFENLSEYDFVTGVSDLTGISDEHIERISATEVRMRDLEASRLHVGSVFFWLDPNRIYTISYYRVTGIIHEDGGMVRLSCETPEISDLLNSYQVEDVPMVMDLSTLRTTEGVDVVRSSSRKLFNEQSNEKGVTLTPHIKLGIVKINGTIQFTYKNTFTCDYSGLSMHSYTKKSTEDIGGSFEIEIEGEKKGEGLTSDGPITLNRFFKRVEKDSEYPLGEVVVFTAGGIVSLELELKLVVKIGVSGEVRYSIKTETTERYSEKDQKIVSQSSKKKNTFSATLQGEFKIGVSFSAILLLGPFEIARVTVFAGLKVKAEFTYDVDIPNQWQLKVIQVWNSEPGSDERKEALAALAQELKDGKISINDLNMTDCIVTTVKLVLEATARLGNDWIHGRTWDLLDLEWEIYKGHGHVWPFKFVCNADDEAEMLRIEQKAFPDDHMHAASKCPLTDMIYLMVPELDSSGNEEGAFGTINLMGRNMLDQAPELDLRKYGYRVTGWYKDKDLQEPAVFPLAVHSNDRLYAAVVEVKAIHLVDYAGETLRDADWEEIECYLAQGETLNTDDLPLPEKEHLIGWYKVNNAAALKITNKNTYARTPNMPLTGDGTEQTWMAIYDNDLRLSFYDGDRDLTDEEIVWGHNLPFPEEMVPAPEGEWEEPETGHYGTYVYTWARKRPWKAAEFTNEKTITFPYEFRERESYVELLTQSVEIKHTDEHDYGVTGSSIGEGNVDLSQYHVYSDEGDFRFSEKTTYVIITGFEFDQETGNTNGSTTTVIPRAISIPKTIKGKPVTMIDAGAFNGNSYDNANKLTSLVYVKVPESVTFIGPSAFANCPALVKLDLGACSGLTALPDRFALDDANLRIVSLPDGIAKIGEDAFNGCASITKAIVNAKIGNRAFRNCSSLGMVKLGRGVTAVGSNAFEGCTALTELIIPCTTSAVGEKFILGCTGLTNLTFDGAPSTITANMMKIGENSHLQKLTLRKGVTSIGSKAFSNGNDGNSYLTDITLPNAPITAYANILTGTAVQRLRVYDLCVGGESMAENCTTLQEVTFENGIIENGTFRGCSNLTTVTMGGGVYSVGEEAFKNCGSLKTITLGENVLYLGKNAFFGCSGLETVNFNDNLDYIGDYAFRDCVKLKDLKPPASVTTFGNNLIDGCVGLETLTVGGAACTTLSGKSLRVGSQTSKLREITVREGVTVLDNGVFNNGGGGYPVLTKVILPSTLTAIGDSVFYGDGALTTINIPANVTTIGTNAFKSCTNVNPTFPQSPKWQSIGEYAFSGCASITAFPLGTCLKQVGREAFRGCTSLEEIDFPATVEEFGVWCIYECKELKTLRLGGSGCPVLSGSGKFSIGLGAKLNELVIREGVTEISNGVFDNHFTYNYYENYGYPYLKKIVLPEGLQIIGNNAFYYRYGDHIPSILEHINIPASVRSIGDNAFSGLIMMPPDLPAEVKWTSVGRYAFYDCKGLTELNFTGDLESIGEYAFYNCTGLRTAELKEGITSVGRNAFAGCSALEEISFPASVNSFGLSVIYGCTSLRKLTVGSSNFPELTGQSLFNIGYNSQLTEIILRDGVTNIGDGVFGNRYDYNLNGYFRLEKVSLPETLETIGTQCFINAGKLQSIRIPSSVKSIGNYAFSGCDALQPELAEDSRLETIGEGAFKYCSAIRTLTPGQFLRTIDKNAFQGCTGLETLILPAGVERYGEAMISGCRNLKTLILGGSGCPEIPSGAFTIGTSSLKTIVLQEGVTAISNNAFSNNGNGYTALEYLSLPSTLESIGDYAFRKAKNMGVVYIPGKTTEISETAFADCPKCQLVYSNDPQYSTGHQLTVYAEETELYSGLVAAGADLNVLLYGLIPGDTEAETFLGWRMEGSDYPLHEVNVMPDFDLTLYAYMTQIRTLQMKIVRNGQTEDYSSIRIGAGKRIPWPDEPYMEGYTFGGWYEDEDMAVAFHGGTLMPDEDKTIYGSMRTSAGGAVYLFAADHAELLRYVPGEQDSTDVWLPAKVNGLPVTKIAKNAFLDAGSITSLHLPDLLTDFDSEELENLPDLYRVSISENNGVFRTIDGILYSADMQEVLRCPRASGVSLYTAPTTVNKVKERAFAFCENLRTVRLGSQVTEIGAQSFNGCRNLVSFTANGLTVIGEEAIGNVSGKLKAYGPIKTGVLREYALNNSIPYNQYGIRLYVNGSLVNAMGLEAGGRIPASVLRITEEDGTVIHTWFTDQTMTKSWEAERETPAEDLDLYTSKTPIYTWENVTLETAGGAVSGIRLTGYYGFGGDLVLPQAIDGKTVIAIGGSFLAECNGIVSSIRIGSDVIEIANTALDGPEAYPFGRTVRADEGSYAWNWAAENGFNPVEGMYILSFETNGGSKIGKLTLAWNTAQLLKEPVKSGCVFRGWYTDEALTIPVALTDNRFIMPNNDVTLYAAWDGEAISWPFEYEADEENNTLIILRYTGNGGSVTIPAEINGAAVTAIASGAFSDSAVTEIIIPAGVAEIGANCFAGCTALTGISVDGNNTVYRSVDGILFAGQTTLLCYPAGKTVKSYTIPETVTTIAEGAFRNVVELESIILPDRLTAIGEEAFADCSGLRTFTINNTMTVSGIPANCFTGCSSLSEVHLGTSITAIGGMAFFDCNALKLLEVSAAEVTVAEEVPVFGTSDLTVRCCYSNPIRQYALDHGFRVFYSDKTQAESVEVSAESVELVVGESTTLQCVILPVAAVDNTDVTWISSDENVIQIHDGKAYAVYSGTAKVTAKAENGIQGSITIRVLHTHVYIPHKAKEATCNSTGSVFYYSCAGCGLFFNEQYEEVEYGAWMLPMVHIHHCNGDQCLICGRVFDYSGLSTLQIPADTTEIETQAFEGIAAEVIILPDGCTSIGVNSFNNCDDLAYLIVFGSIPTQEILTALGNSKPETLLRNCGE